VLVPSNAKMKPLTFDPSDVSIFGKVVTVLRRM
jgi:SOS-response transcriptional repressor LexA